MDLMQVLHCGIAWMTGCADNGWGRLPGWGTSLVGSTWQQLDDLRHVQGSPVNGGAAMQLREVLSWLDCLLFRWLG